jgi:protein-disulfide isomerase
VPVDARALEGTTPVERDIQGGSSMHTTRRKAALLGLATACLGLVRARVAGAADMGELVLGDPNAPVTVVEYASLSCDHCGEFHRETLPALKERYIDTGKVKLVFRDFPLEQNALRAAMIARCAGPERRYRFIDVFFKQQEGWSHARDPLAAIKQLAKLGGFSDQQVEACLADKALEDAILYARLDGQQKYGVRSTPTFVINDKIYSGNRSIEEFAAILDPLLG